MPAKFTTHLKYFLPILIVLLALSSNQWVYAQATKDPWSPPVNLSNSGFTNNPVAVRDSNGIIHGIWQDVDEEFVYTRYKEGEWSEPIKVAFPFEDTPPLLLPDSKGTIHAFWIDREGSLAYTRMFANQQALSWDSPQFIAEAALSFDATIDTNDDDLHLIYVRPMESLDVPSGVYYRQSKNRGSTWIPGKLLYPSRYFRGLEKIDTNVSIASTGDGEQTRIYAAWDNKPRKRSFFSMSLDDGNQWSDPEEIQGGDTYYNYLGTNGIKVGAVGNNVLLIWQMGVGGNGCIQTYQSSPDAGENWESPEAMLTDLDGCPQENFLLTSGASSIFLMTEIQDQWYLLNWNGSQWSDPQFQRTLTGFVDPETEDMVLYACHNPFFLPDGQMFVVGCDEGKGRDIWATSAPMGDTNQWFPPPPVWSDPHTIQEGDAEISSPSIIADSQGRFHAIWSQLEVLEGTNTSTPPKSVIYYSINESSGWSTPVKVLSSPVGDADQPTIAMNSKDRLILVWREEQSGSLYFSWANATKASNPSEWATPIQLPEIQPLAVSPMVALDRADRVYVVFAIPINEDRGIYLTTSSDDGQTWSSPLRVVDAVEAGWEMVDQPQIVITAGGQLHVIWKLFKVIRDPAYLGVYYAQSVDDGQSWSLPQAMVEGPVYWSSMATKGDGSIRLVWQGKSFQGFEIKQQVSSDSGQTWSRPSTIVELGNPLTPASLAEGNGEDSSLLVIAEEPLNRSVLRHWIWKGDKWAEDASTDLVNEPAIRVYAVNSVIAPQGKLGVIYSQEKAGLAGEEKNYQLLFVDRPVEPLSQLPTPAPDPVATQTFTPTEEAIITSAPSQIVTPSPVVPTQPSVSSRSRNEIVLGVVMILLVLGVAIGLAVRIILKRRI